MDSATKEVWIAVSYIAVEVNAGGARPSGSGLTRMRLATLPAWLTARPGTMIVRLEVCA